MKLSWLVTVAACTVTRASAFSPTITNQQKQVGQRLLVTTTARNLYTPQGLTTSNRLLSSSRNSNNNNFFQSVHPFHDSTIVNSGLYRRQRISSTSSSTSMFMILDRLFGGGAISAGIVYDNLDHPGPELAAAAKAGTVLTVSEKDPTLQIATFAGGCFWGLELAYQRVPGVVYTAVGYTQGKEQTPTYNQVCAGMTGHTEAVIVYYNPNECTYEQLLDTFFERVNPLTVNGQGNDYGKQYRTGVYPHTVEQMTIATKRFNIEQQKHGPSRKIATELLNATPFWPAEKYHQQYLEKGGRMGSPQSAEKGSTDPIRCYG